MYRLPRQPAPWHRWLASLLVLTGLLLATLPGTATLHAQLGDPLNLLPLCAPTSAHSCRLNWPKPLAPSLSWSSCETSLIRRALLAAAEVGTADALARRRALYAGLTADAASSQAPLRAWLDADGVAYRPFYLVNMLEVTGDLALAEALRRQPGVDRLARNPAVAQAHSVAWGPQWPQLAAVEVQSSAAMPYGLTFTKADQVWAMGIRGQGVVVASQDTGVEWEHPALQAHYRGWNSTTMSVTHPYNWFDAFGRNGGDTRCSSDAQVPCDDNGHGTHTTGTMLGDATPAGGTILGMAPDAEWIACRNMRRGVGEPASYTACFEFFIAPYPQGGDPFTDGRPELAPQVVNNSWGCPPSEGCDVDSLRQVVETTRAAGIFVAASAGNVGYFGCASVIDPIAIYDATFTVGAHDATGSLAAFSSRGPVTVDGSNRRKPDIAAPGVGVYSAYLNGGYVTLGGTSMASPHVAGAVALLWSAVPTLTGEIDLSEQILLASAVPVSTNECASEVQSASPNNLYGFGWLDIKAAVELAKLPSSLTVTLSDGNAHANPGVAISVVDRNTGFSSTILTDSDGTARWGSAEPGGALFEGEYDVIVQGGCPSGQVRLLRGAHLDLTMSASCLWLPGVFR